MLSKDQNQGPHLAPSPHGPSMTALWYSFRPLERLDGGGTSHFGFLTGFVAVVEAIKLGFYVNLMGWS